MMQIKWDPTRRKMVYALLSGRIIPVAEFTDLSHEIAHKNGYRCADIFATYFSAAASGYIPILPPLRTNLRMQLCELDIAYVHQ